MSEIHNSDTGALLTGSNNLAAYAGTPYSTSNKLPVTPLDISHIDVEFTRADELDLRAKEIYYAGKALEFFRKACAKLHAGDGNIVTSLFLSAGLVYVKNSNGLDICITGQAGTGKSHVVDTVKKFIPPDRIFASRFSNKALFYHQDKIKEGQIIHMDDQGMSEAFEEVYKGQSTNWNEPYKYETLGKDNKPLELELPAKLTFWITKMEGVGDEQTRNRLLMFETSEDREQLERIRKTQIEALLNPDFSQDTTDQEIAQRIWGYILPETVVVPFGKDIQNSDLTDTRNFNMMCELMKASALFSAPLRNRTPDGKIEASIEDFELAAQIINPLLSNHGGSQKLKLNPDANRLLKVLATLETRDYTLRELQDISGMAQSQVHRAISGRNANDHGGLAEKCSAITTKRITYPTVGGNTHEKGIFWNRAEYEKRCGDTAGLFSMDESQVMYWKTNEESKHT